MSDGFGEEGFSLVTRPGAEPEPVGRRSSMMARLTASAASLAWTKPTSVSRPRSKQMLHGCSFLGGLIVRWNLAEAAAFKSIAGSLPPSPIRR